MYTENCLNGRASSRRSRTLRAKEWQDKRPGLAGCLAAARRLTAESMGEQSSANAPTDEEHAVFSDLDARCTEKFGFSFMFAVCDLDRMDILVAFKRLIESGR